MEKVVNAILDEITAAMARGGRVELRGFGGAHDAWFFRKVAASCDCNLVLDRLNSAGVTSAQDIVVYLDAQEPGSDNRITLNNLTLNVYGQSGDNSQKFTASYEGLPLNPTVCPGQGNNCVTSTTRRQGYCSQFLAPRSRGVNGELLRRHRRSRPTVPYRMPKWRVRGRQL